MTFTEKFGSFVGDGDSIKCEVDGFECVATVYHDDTQNAPWEREDGHGDVSAWTSRKKDPSERVLCSDRHGMHRYYDFAGSVVKAREEGWGGILPGVSMRNRAAKAAEEDFKVLKSWCDDEWHYSGVDVRVWLKGIPLTREYHHAVWGIQRNYPGSDNDYLREVANEQLPEALEDARNKLAELCEAGKYGNSFQQENENVNET